MLSRYLKSIFLRNLHQNKQNMRKSVVYNNIRSIESATITVGTENISGVLFQFDINNVPEEGKKINEDTVSYVVAQGTAILSPESVKEMI